MKANEFKQSIFDILHDQRSIEIYKVSSKFKSLKDVSNYTTTKYGLDPEIAQAINNCVKIVEDSKAIDIAVLLTIKLFEEGKA